jgi:hypothetical protein
MSLDWARRDTTLADAQSIDHAAVDVAGFDRQVLNMGLPTAQPEVAGSLITVSIHWWRRIFD